MANHRFNLAVIDLGAYGADPSDSTASGNSAVNDELLNPYPNDVSILDHSLIPFRGNTIYLRLVDTMTKALTYAAGGFHSAVARGLTGGAGDEHGVTDGTRAGQMPAKPLMRDDIQSAWIDAAKAYKRAWDLGMSQKNSAALLVSVKAALAEANILADRAYALEHVEPPRDPKSDRPEIASNTSGSSASGGGSAGGVKSFLTSGTGMVVAGLGIIALLAVVGQRHTVGGRSSESSLPVV